MKKYFIYKIINTVNNRYYIGVHYAYDMSDNYYGSGPLIKAALIKYGKEAFKKEILWETDNRDEAYLKEEEFVIPYSNDKLSYNLKVGGIGGWDWYNASDIKTQCMHNPKIAEKVSSTLKKKYIEDVDYRNRLNEISREASKAAQVINAGKSRPNHSKIMKELHESGAYDNSDSFRKPSVFKVIKPDGSEIIVYNLGEFCYNNDLPYTSIWNTHLSGRSVKKGRAKNWRCELLKKGYYGKTIEHKDRN